MGEAYCCGGFCFVGFFFSSNSQLWHKCRLKSNIVQLVWKAKEPRIKSPFWRDYWARRLLWNTECLEFWFIYLCIFPLLLLVTSGAGCTAAVVVTVKTQAISPASKNERALKHGRGWEKTKVKRVRDRIP
jgi:hypothetical protein